MKTLVAATMLAFLVTTPVYAQGNDTDPSTGSINDENRSRMNTGDLRMVGMDGDMVLVRDRRGRTFRMPLSFFQDTDPSTGSINDENRNRMNTADGN